MVFDSKAETIDFDRGSVETQILNTVYVVQTEII